MLIAQITDAHIVEKGEHWLNEPATQTHERLKKVVCYLNQLKPLPDIVLFTGDASDTGTEASYNHLKELLQPLKIPFFVIPGNHDCRENLRNAFKEHSYIPKQGFLHYTIENYPIALIGLDTLTEEDGGEICQERFEWLKNLTRAISKPTLLFMHHPPTRVGNKLFDSIQCQVPKEFEEFIRAQDQLLGIVTGHYHHFCLTFYGNKPCFIAPSIAPVHYFANFQDTHVTALELQDPAISLHQWNGGKHFISHVIRIKNEDQRIDWASLKRKA